MKDILIILVFFTGAFCGFAWGCVYADSPSSPDPAINAVIEHNYHLQNLLEYQIDLRPDSAYVYDNGRFVGKCKHGQDGIDSVILQNNL